MLNGQKLFPDRSGRHKKLTGKAGGGGNEEKPNQFQQFLCGVSTCGIKKMANMFAPKAFDAITW